MRPAWLCTLALAACVGMLEPNGPTSEVDAGSATGTGGSGGSNVGAGGAGGAGGGATCVSAVASNGNGHHNPGTDCLGCHASLSGFTWTVAGTLYDAAGNPIGGATIELVDANNQTLQLATAQNGNFWTTQAVAYPLHTRASQCPSDTAMVSTVQQGSCNSCHGTSMRIHLP